MKRPPEARRSLGDSTYAAVREWIERGTIAPGSSLREEEIARRLSTSRTPVREALRRLQAEGLISRSERGGYSLSEFSREDLAKLYDVRETLEAMAIRLAARNRTRAHLGRLADILEAMNRAVEADDYRRVATLAANFHDTIFEASGNPFLSDILANVHGLLVRYRPRTDADADLRKELHAQHYALLEALIDGDAERGERLVREHITHALNVRLRDTAAVVPAVGEPED